MAPPWYVAVETFDAGLTIRPILEDAWQVIGSQRFGYLTQALAAHVLMHLGVHVRELRSTGHPDITGRCATGTYRAEVEAHLTATANLCDADCQGVKPLRPGDRGVLALLVVRPIPRWYVINYASLERRGVIPSIAVLRVIADPVESRLWTEELVKLVTRMGPGLQFGSYRVLRDKAIAGVMI